MCDFDVAIPSHPTDSRRDQQLPGTARPARIPSRLQLQDARIVARHQGGLSRHRLPRWLPRRRWHPRRPVRGLFSPFVRPFQKLTPLSNSLSAAGNDFIVFCRKGQLQEVHWAGNPHANKTVGADDYRPLEPRKSFKIWSETIVGKSRAWTDEEKETASVLCLVYGASAHACPPSIDGSGSSLIPSDQANSSPSGVRRRARSPRVSSRTSCWPMRVTKVSCFSRDRLAD